MRRKEIAEVKNFAYNYTLKIDSRQEGEQYLGLKITMKNIWDSLSICRSEKMNRRADDRYGRQTR